MEKVILTEEVRTLGLVIRDVRLIQKRVAKAEAKARPGNVVDVNELSNNDNGSKGSSVIKIREVSNYRL